MDPELAAYVEDVALYWEAQGLPRIAGRIVGLLLVCDPPHRSPGELVEELGVSKGSVSAMTRLLVEAGTIEVVAVPGGRATYYRLTPESLERRFERRLRSFTSFGALAQRGLELLEDEPAERTARLRRIASLYAFLERELPLLLERWHAETGHD
ncbi:MAG: MarR family transcriptional regulator [Myxococcales bacterium]|nr:MarR family transcriptional regulator [Myxococcales bacterium]